jgi:hypothetical protein
MTTEYKVGDFVLVPAIVVGTGRCGPFAQEQVVDLKLFHDSKDIDVKPTPTVTCYATNVFKPEKDQI